MYQNLNFKISAALKDIIGRDLISDDFAAIFELVKNSYDAGATNVKISFENIYSENAQIKIVDDGKGMTYDDLVNKWLFVAYSAKKDGSEDNDIHRVYAGAKGIGRFACDSLGKKLFLQSISKRDYVINSIMVDWDSFENNSKTVFQDIDIEYSDSIKKEIENESGTYIEINNLRNQWSREKLLKLKESLAKLILPNDFSNSSHSFGISMDVKDEVERDKHELDYPRIVNGPIENFIFQRLQIKTTRIESYISENAETITTSLYDGTNLIYKIVERNEFHLLDNIQIELYYLNRAAKYTFTQKMGIRPRNYGNIFMYKNGFRIYPYGEPGEDPLKIDSRKAQGYNRFLGTRELIGQIKIDSTSSDLKESSSRSDGLLKTAAYHQLTGFFLEVLRKLEKYVVDTQLWGLDLDTNYSDIFAERINELVYKLTDSEKIINVHVPSDIFDVLGASTKGSAEGLIANLQSIAQKNNDIRLLDDANALQERLEKLKQAKLEAEVEAKEESKKAELATKDLKEKIQENFFLKSLNTSDYQEVLALLHHIGIYAGTIDNSLRNISLRMQNDIEVTKDRLEEVIKTISFETKKIISIVGFATKANFKLKSEDITSDLGSYIYDYIQNISPTVSSKNIDIELFATPSFQFTRTFKPIELNIVIDNIISNAVKAKADQIIVRFLEVDKKLVVSFEDNGTGIDNNSLSKIYDFGFTTTDGSGLGLFHIKKILDSGENKIEISNNENNKGVTAKIIFK